jgi:hypothetical protein
MNRPSLPTPHSPPAAAPLPAWSQLAQTHRHELTATLAAMILKQLPPRPTAPSEVRDER